MKYYIVLLASLGTIMGQAQTAKSLHARYWSFLKTLNESDKVYSKFVYYQIDKDEQESERAVQEVWRTNNRTHIKTRLSDEYIDSTHQVSVIHLDKQVVIYKTGIDEMNKGKEQAESLFQYDSLLRYADLSVVNKELHISYKQEFQAAYKAEKVVIAFDQSKPILIKTIYKGNTSFMLIEKLDTSIETIAFKGRALNQVLSKGQLLSAYKNYELVNLTREKL